MPPSSKGSTDKKDSGRRKAYEAAARIYTAGLLAGAKSWIDGSQLMADSTWRYYRRFNDRMMSPADAGGKTDAQAWREQLENDLRSYLRDLENVQIQFQADFQKRAFGIIEDVFERDEAKDGSKSTG
ncbi:MAG TPA: hypothetical protein VF493_20355 [Terriglobales bacterium]